MNTANNHKLATRDTKLHTYRPTGLRIKQIVSNVSAVETGAVNVMSFGSLSISATCTFDFQCQVYYNTLVKGGGGDQVLVHTLLGTAGVPFFVCLPIKGEVLQLKFSTTDGNPPAANSTILVNSLLGYSTAFKLIP